MLSALVVAIAINEFVADKLKISEDNFKKTLLLIPVSIILWGLRKIPVVGSWISIIVFFCGVGILILYQFDSRRKESIVDTKQGE